MTFLKRIGTISLTALFVLLLFTPSFPQTEVYLEISKSPGEKIEIAIPDFEPSAKEGTTISEDLSKKITDIIKNDLRIYGLFNLIENRQFLREASEADKKLGSIDFKEWSLLGAHALIKGTYHLENDEVSIEARLYDVNRGTQITGKRYTSKRNALRAIIHKFSDEVIYRFTGEQGIAQTKIAFESRVGRQKEIFVMDFDGHNIRKLTYNNALSLSPAWSHDGGGIIYTTYKDNNPDLYLLDLKNGLNKPFSLYPGLNISPAWSPDGKKVALIMSRDGNPEVYTLNSKGRYPQRLTNSRAVEASPAWSPNGRQITFTSDRSGGPQIYVMDLEGTNLRRLTYEGSYNDEAIWSPKGDKIAFVSKRNGPFNIYVMNVDGSDVRQLTSHSGSNESPSWSPDGNFIVFSSTRNGKRQLFFMKADGSGQKALTFLQGGGYNPSWGPRSPER